MLDALATFGHLLPLVADNPHSPSLTGHPMRRVTRCASVIYRIDFGLISAHITSNSILSEPCTGLGKQVASAALLAHCAKDAAHGQLAKEPPRSLRAPPAQQL